MNIIVDKTQLKSDLARYLHGCAFSPVISTFKTAIGKGNFVTWPGIDSINFKKLVGPTVPTSKGHLDQERQGLQSTKTNIKLENAHADAFPDKDIKSRTYGITITELKNVAYSDLTGQFPHVSSRGNKYLLTIYNHDANAILASSLKTRQAKEIATVWERKHLQLTKHGHTVQYYIMDNECSQDLQRALVNNDLDYQLVPPNQHRRNAAERAIRTFKNHLLAGLATCDPKFLIHEWDQLLDQAEFTINLLRNSRVNPKLSAHAYLHGVHNFNKIPLAPLGTRAVVHAKPDKRASWAYHGEDGWYVGPAPHHYRCFKVYMPETHKEKISDTVQLIPSRLPIPSATLEDHIAHAADKLVTALQHYSTTPPPGIIIGDPTIQGLRQIANILKTMYPMPSPPPPMPLPIIPPQPLSSPPILPSTIPP